MYNNKQQTLVHDKYKLLVTDKNSRVYLMDGKTMLLLKVWKGYRDATLSLLNLNFLVIFLPKRNIMEIYDIQSQFNRK
jgi:hypothetical protein